MEILTHPPKRVARNKNVSAGAGPVSLGAIGPVRPRTEADRAAAVEEGKRHLGKVQTASIVVGTDACNARCRFCIAQMTPEHGITIKRPVIDWDRFDTFMEYAHAGNAETAMITGKGEPTLFPDDIGSYLQRLEKNERRLDFRFHSKELQTNGILIAENPTQFNPLLKQWADLGLTTVAVSIVHYDAEVNRQEYLPYKSTYIDLLALIDQIHAAGIQVRLACVLLDGGIDSAAKLRELIQFSRAHGVEQLTVRPVDRPDRSRNDEVSNFVRRQYLKPAQLEDLSDYLNRNGSLIGTLPFGARIYDVSGQNVCLTNCLTVDKAGFCRQLICYPEGMITTGWTEDARQLP
jgi:molybdenum cofactor biosynthesis enzyme MoaA